MKERKVEGMAGKVRFGGRQQNKRSREGKKVLKSEEQMSW